MDRSHRDYFGRNAVLRRRRPDGDDGKYATFLVRASDRERWPELASASRVVVRYDRCGWVRVTAYRADGSVLAAARPEAPSAPPDGSARAGMRKNIRRYTDSKLHKEMAFASADGDRPEGSPERIWHDELSAERARRGLPDDFVDRGPGALSA